MLDSTIVRPGCTAIAAPALRPAGGVLAAKAVADLIFYVPVICTYELPRRRAERALAADAAGMR